ncbi:MAG: hypothetical protein RIB80_04575 [Rhodospirillales bacterium]
MKELFDLIKVVKMATSKSTKPRKGSKRKGGKKTAGFTMPNKARKGKG